MLRRWMLPVGGRRSSAPVVLLILALAGLVPTGTSLAGPPAQTPLVLRGANVDLPTGFTVEGQAGLHIESRVLTLPTQQTSIVYLSAPLQAPFPFSDVAPSWNNLTPPGPDGAPDTSAVAVELRTSPDGAAWTDWQASDLEDIVDPREPPTHTFASLVGVPQDVRTHRYAQARITLSAAPGAPTPQIANLVLSFIDAGVTTQVPVATVAGGPAPAKPPVISRAAWGSPEPYSSPSWPPEYRRVTHVIVHHTETANTDGDFAARVRSIWYFHAITRGWGDIGYNYLIDPRGNVYEGRYGGDDVAAGHAYPFNYGSLGVSLIGNYDTAPVPSAMRDSLIHLLAWEADRRQIDPQGTGTFTGALNCGGSVTLVRPNIAGHRDFRGTGCGQEFNAKTCPGAYAYALLPTIRAALGTGLPAHRALFDSSTTPPAMAPGSSAAATVVVRNGGSLTWPRSGPNPVHLGYHWYTVAGQVVTSGYQDFRTSLPQDVPYGATVTLAAQVGAPATPGVYELRWDMVHEYVTWFVDSGSAPLAVRVNVVAQDTTPPTARVLPLPPYEGETGFVVNWSGADEPGGSGLASYDVQVRSGALGAWQDWQPSTTATSAFFSGSEGQTYAFRARARDHAGNQGAYPAAADTVTTVASLPPSLVISRPQDGQRVPPGPLTVAGRTDPGALARVNGVDTAVAPDGAFTTTLTASGQDFPVTVDVQSPAGKAARNSVLVHVGGRFSDVPLGYWAYNAIDYLDQLGVISGYADGTFRPDGAITRAQYMKMVVTALRWAPAAPSVARFRDVPLDYWASPFVETAVAHGLIAGYADGGFHPADNVTRAQVVKVLVLAAGWPLQEEAVSPFGDVPVVYWAYPYVETAYRHGIIQDSLAGRFRPDAPASRAEVAQMLYYALGDLAASGKWPPPP